MVVATQELGPSPALDNLLRAAEESAIQQAPALKDGLSRIQAKNRGSMGARGRGYSLKAAYESAKAASLQKALFDGLRRDTKQITDLILQASQ